MVAINSSRSLVTLGFSIEITQEAVFHMIVCYILWYYCIIQKPSLVNVERVSAVHLLQLGYILRVII